jgi:hypothetical protein
MVGIAAPTGYTLGPRESEASPDLTVRALSQPATRILRVLLHGVLASAASLHSWQPVAVQGLIPHHRLATAQQAQEFFVGHLNSDLDALATTLGFPGNFESTCLVVHGAFAELIEVRAFESISLCCINRISIRRGQAPHHVTLNCEIHSSA